MRKTTDKRTMKRIVNEYISAKRNIMSLCVEYWNELATGYYIEHEELFYNIEQNLYYECENEKRTYTSVADVCTECLYWLSCYYESGNIRHDEEFKDRKAFINFLSVFIPFTKLKVKEFGIPNNKDTSILF